MYYEVTEGIQDSGTYIHQDVELKLKNSCEMPRADLADKLGRLKDFQENMAHGMGILSVL